MLFVIKYNKKQIVYRNFYKIVSQFTVSLIKLKYYSLKKKKKKQVCESEPSLEQKIMDSLV